MTTDTVCFNELRKVYPDGTVAVDGVSFSIPRGQFCVLLGPSGAGKSTLLRGVNGLMLPTSGSVSVDGMDVVPHNYRNVRRRVGMIFQGYNLSPRLPVIDNVCAGATATLPLWRILSKAFGKTLSRRACALLERVGLEEKHVYRRACELSGGQQQRVGIARAFILEPAVILADEPVASLDPNTSAEILALLRDASRERECTVLCSLHQIDLARSFADRIVGMGAGRIVFDGPPEELNDDALRQIYGAREPLPMRQAPEARLALEAV